ncbi:MAG: GntR family transcriptional regulator [Bryobacterales bacterium]|nr:GntR family transcriptional regulator [Bryobacterales bacterium]
MSALDQTSSYLAALERVKPVSVADQVSSRLREAILLGHFKPGERLVERRLAEVMGVSLSSIRDALQQLDREGLVNRQANTATRVTELSSEKLHEMIKVRLLLEPAAMALACRRMTTPRVEELQSIVTEIDRLVSSNDFYQVSRADLRFHQTVWKIGGNATLERILSELCTPFFAFLMILMSVKHEDLGKRIISHQILLDLLKTGNEAVVEAAAREHILTSWHPFLGQY